MQELWFLHSARRLMLIDIHKKFREDILNGFHLIERTLILALWTLTNVDWYS